MENAHEDFQVCLGKQLRHKEKLRVPGAGCLVEGLWELMLSPATPVFHPVGFNFSSTTPTPTCGSLSPHPHGALGWELPSLWDSREIWVSLAIQVPLCWHIPNREYLVYSRTGSSHAMTGGSPHLNTAVHQFIQIKNRESSE